MSRTNHHRHQKRHHIGEDLWSRRPCGGKPYEAYYKRLTISRERAAESQMLHKAKRDPSETVII